MDGLPQFLVLAAEEAGKAAGGFGFSVDSATRAAVAMLLGLLLGAEREFAHTDKEALFAGVRTFPIISLLGFMAAFFGDVTSSPMVFAVLSLSFGLLVVASYVLTSLGEDKGATTEIAGLMAYFLGAMCFHEKTLPFASALAVTVAVLLSMREAIHGAVAKFEREDIYATLKLAIVTLIVLPLLPNVLYGIRDIEAFKNLPDFKVLNPHKTWTYVVIIASISFAGYVAVKVLGTRVGVGLTGVFGGLVSSTAVALTFSRKSKETPALSRSFASAIILASTVKFPAVLIVASGICPPLLGLLWKPLGLCLVTGVAAGALLHFRSEKDEHATEGVTFKNPFELGSAVKFGLLLTFIAVASRAAHELFKDRGYYLVNALLGLADVDGPAIQAATLSQEQLAAAGGDPAKVPFLSTAATAILLALLSNTVVKGSLTVGLGSKELRRYTVPAFAALTVAGIAAAVFLV